MTKKEKIILNSLLVVLSLIFISILIFLGANNFLETKLDKTILDFFIQNRGDRKSFTFFFFRAITEYGHTLCTIILILIVGILFKFKKKFWLFSSTILSSLIIQRVLKLIINRPRPNEMFWWMNETSSSFPSGHSLTAGCVYMLLILIILNSKEFKNSTKIIVTTFSSIIMFLVPVSRLVLSVHYFTDVVAGLCLGMIISITAHILFKVITNKNKKEENQKEAPKTATMQKD